MKHFSLLFLFALLGVFNCYSHNYKIIYLSSPKAVTINKKLCDIGDVFSDTAEMKWTDDRQVMKVYNTQTKKQYIICAKCIEKESFSLSEYFFQSKTLASRNAGINSPLTLSDFFQGKIIIDRQIIIPTQILQDDNHFFYLTYQHKNTQVNKAIPPNPDKIVLSVDSIFCIDQVAIKPYAIEASLFYYDATEETSICISPSFWIIPAL